MLHWIYDISGQISQKALGGVWATLLLDKGVAWYWLPKHERAVQEIKRMITDMPILKYYDTDMPVAIQSDTSKNGLGCCGIRLLGTLLNKTIPKSRKNAWAWFACQRFYHYLFGRKTIIAEADHKPLVTFFKKLLLSAPKHLQSMMLQLQNYNLTVVYKPGPEIYISDMLSRAVLNKQVSDKPGLLQHTVSTMDSSSEEEWRSTHWKTKWPALPQ